MTNDRPKKTASKENKYCNTNRYVPKSFRFHKFPPHRNGLTSVFFSFSHNLWLTAFILSLSWKEHLQRKCLPTCLYNLVDFKDLTFQPVSRIWCQLHCHSIHWQEIFPRKDIKTTVKFLKHSYITKRKASVLLSSTLKMTSLSVEWL
jgi:hypothetical protein